MKIGVLDIGGTAIKSGIYEGGKLTMVMECPTEAKKGGVQVMNNAIAALSRLGEFDCIGVSTAGQVDTKKGCIKYANSNIPGYTGMDVRNILHSAFHVPVSVINDVNAAAMGELHYGAGIGHSDFLCLTFGTGIGGAIVMNGKVYEGTSFSAGEVGAMLLHPEDRNASVDKFSGCFERYASTTALIAKAQKVDKDMIDGKTIFANVNRGVINEVIEEWIKEIVYGLTSLIHIFNPTCIILGGGVMKQQLVLERINELLSAEIMESYQGVQMISAKLGNLAGLYGAAYYAMTNLQAQ